MNATTHHKNRQGPRTTDRVDFDELTPEWLEGEIDYDVFDELEVFRHRGSTVDANELINHLSAGLETKAIHEGDSSEPSTLLFHNAIRFACTCIRKQYPGWFGDEEALNLLGATMPVSDDNLRLNGLIGAYYGDRILACDDPVENTFDDHMRVIVPFVAVVLSEVKAQMDADRDVQVEKGRKEILRTVVSNVHHYDIPEEVLDETIQKAKDGLASR